MFTFAKKEKYWQRWGATEFFRDKVCVYYLLIVCKINFERWIY